jgi:hypothetical protein
MTRKQKITALLSQIEKWYALMQRLEASENLIQAAFPLREIPDCLQVAYDALDLYSSTFDDTSIYGSWCNYFYFDCEQGKKTCSVKINGKPRPLKTLKDLAGIIIDTQ